MQVWHGITVSELCWDDGGNITSIHSPEENDFINGINFDHFFVQISTVPNLLRQNFR